MPCNIFMLWPRMECACKLKIFLKRSNLDYVESVGIFSKVCPLFRGGKTTTYLILFRSSQSDIDLKERMQHTIKR